MGERNVKFGLTLPNRGVITGATTMDEMLALAQMADKEPIWDSVWVGDSILAKPRLDAIALLGALAVKTERVKLGPACFASTPLRNALLLAYQWASLPELAKSQRPFCLLDVLHGGRCAQVLRRTPPDPRCYRAGRREESLPYTPQA